MPRVKVNSITMIITRIKDGLIMGGGVTGPRFKGDWARVVQEPSLFIQQEMGTRVSPDSELGKVKVVRKRSCTLPQLRRCQHKLALCIYTASVKTSLYSIRFTQLYHSIG